MATGAWHIRVNDSNSGFQDKITEVLAIIEDGIGEVVDVKYQMVYQQDNEENHGHALYSALIIYRFDDDDEADS